MSVLEHCDGDRVLDPAGEPRSPAFARKSEAGRFWVASLDKKGAA
jgi:hypothetical protein